MGTQCSHPDALPAKLNFEYNGVENRHAFHDVGAASTTLAIQAAVGLFIHQMAGFDVSKAKEIYGIPSGYEPVAAIALGYFGDPQTLSEKLQQPENAPRTRKPLEEFVFLRWLESNFTSGYKLNKSILIAT